MEGRQGVSTAPDRTRQTGVGLEPLVLPAGWWDIQLTYSVSEQLEAWAGSLASVRVAPGHATTIFSRAKVPAGRLAPRVLLNAQDSDADFKVALFEASVAAAVQAAEKAERVAARRAEREPRVSAVPPTGEANEPIWMGSISELPPLASGSLVARIAHDDGVHWPSVAWYDDIAIPTNMEFTEPVWHLRRGDALNPTGPGLLLTATNFGEDVTKDSQVYLYRSEDDVLHASALVHGSAGQYFDVPAGEYTLRLVYRPIGPANTVLGERIVPGFEIRETGVTHQTVDLHYPMAWLNLQVLDAEIDISEDVDLVVLREGAARDAARRVLDEAGVGQHVLPAGTYDIYVSYVPLDERDPIEATFLSVVLGSGDRWEQQWQARRVPWAAHPIAL